MPDKKTEEKTEAYLGTWADKEAAEAGLTNMQSKMTGMGDELGALREQVAGANQTITDLRSQSSQAQADATSEQESELAEVQKEMMELDDGDPNYHQNMMDLTAKSNALSAGIQHVKTLSAATSVFKQELDTRDKKAIHNQFYKDNPDFNTPEMQEEIQKRLTQDPTGMEDSLTIYRAVQTEKAMEQARAFQSENEELKELANVTEGTKKTGKVVVEDGQTPSASTPTSLTGADLDQAMLAAVQAAK